MKINIFFINKINKLFNISSQLDVKGFLHQMHLDDSEYEMGHTKIFMRESQKQKLDNHLHTTILSRIIAIQRWYRTIRQRQHFLTLRAAVIRIQVSDLI